MSDERDIVSDGRLDGERSLEQIHVDRYGALSHGAHVSCASCGWDADGDLNVVDRYITDSPPIPDSLDLREIYVGDDPESRSPQCPTCGIRVGIGDVEIAR